MWNRKEEAMSKIAKKIGIGILVIICILLIIILISFVNHKIKLKKESKLFKPLGKMVKVKEHSIHS
ncbi:radical SAM protein [Clostridium botulinum]|nr:radical SAM protein [Clostridium botulinum]